MQIKTLDWFTSEYPKHSKAKLDMGKSCIRFKKIDQIPFKLIEELVKNDSQRLDYNLRKRSEEVVSTQTASKILNSLNGYSVYR